MWTFCIRRETGYCAIQYYIVQGETIDTYETDDYAGTTVVRTISYILLSFRGGRDRDIVLRLSKKFSTLSKTSK